MIAQYLIDWASIETRVEEAKDNKDAQILRMQLSSWREKIEKNGVVIVDEDSCLIEKQKRPSNQPERRNYKINIYLSFSLRTFMSLGV